jgi:hypothetical protein
LKSIIILILPALLSQALESPLRLTRHKHHPMLAKAAWMTATGECPFHTVMLRNPMIFLHFSVSAGAQQSPQPVRGWKIRG